LASLGLGAAMHGKRGDLIFADVKRQTDLSEKIAPPKYPFKIDNDAAKRGAPLFEQNCNSCNGGRESDKRLFAVADVGTEPNARKRFIAARVRSMKRKWVMPTTALTFSIPLAAAIPIPGMTTEQSSPRTRSAISLNI